MKQHMANREWRMGKAGTRCDCDGAIDAVCRVIARQHSAHLPFAIRHSPLH
jgi:hypothetical protein